jgi:hypothetical protein
MNENNNYPLLIVFYLDREMMMNPDIIKPFADSVNDALTQRKANAMAFFLPTDGDERVECINPIQVKETDMEKINQMVEDIKKNFDISQGADEGKDNPNNLVSTNEINNELSTTWNYKGYKEMEGPHTQNDWNQTLMTKINQISAKMYQASEKGGADTITTSPRMQKLLTSLMYYTPGKLSDKHVNISEDINEDIIILTSTKHEYTGYINIEDYELDE